MSNASKFTYPQGVKPCAQCGVDIPCGCLICAACSRENMIKMRKDKPWLFAKKGI